MMETFLTLLGVRRRPKPEHVRKFEEAKARLNGALEQRDPIGDMLGGMARRAPVVAPSKKKKRRRSY